MKTFLVMVSLWSALSGDPQANASGCLADCPEPPPPPPSGPVFSCNGADDHGAWVELNIRQGYGYDATYDLTQAGSEALRGTARGDSYSECGSRTDPCQMITITQFRLTHPNAVFTMITPLGSPQGKGDFAIYGDGMSDSATETIPLTCQIRPGG